MSRNSKVGTRNVCQSCSRIFRLHIFLSLEHSFILFREFETCRGLRILFAPAIWMLLATNLNFCLLHIFCCICMCIAQFFQSDDASFQQVNWKSVSLAWRQGIFKQPDFEDVFRGPVFPWWEFSTLFCYGMKVGLLCHTELISCLQAIIFETCMISKVFQPWSSDSKTCHDCRWIS